MKFVVLILAIAVIAFCVVGLIMAANRAQRRRRERRDLLHQLQMLHNLFGLVENEVDLQERAGYSDVVAFRNLINDYKELQP